MKIHYTTILIVHLCKGKRQNCKQLFMYMNNWDKGVAPAICPCIFGTGEYSLSAAAAPLDLHLLMYFSL